MTAIRALVRKDLRSRFHSPVGTVVMLLFPLVLVGVIGAAFGPSGGGTTIPPTRLLVENHDETQLGRFLAGALQNEQAAEYVRAEPVEPGTGEAIVAEGDAAALLIIPEGFSDDLLDGVPAELTLIRDPGKTITPEIAETFARIITGFLDTASRVLREPLAEVADFMEGDGPPSDAAIAAVSILMSHRLQDAERLLYPPAIRVVETVIEEEEEDGPGGTVNIFAYIFPGMLALGLLFVGQISMRELIREREAGHLARLLSSPTPMRSILLSKWIGTILLLVLCHLLVAFAGRLIFGIPLGKIEAALLMVLAEGVAITGVMALLFSITRTERQGDALSSVVILGMSILGGSMMPLEMLPEAMQRIGRLTLNYYAIQGFQQVIVWGGGAREVLPYAAVLAAIGVVTGGIGTILFPRQLRRGIR
ncbi:MAG: ABC transporter permease [Candidatus Eisenbacteria bacterium]|nr:ABC transporter permease [Candidatus Eisenbacteria bacterium]